MQNNTHVHGYEKRSIALLYDWLVCFLSPINKNNLNLKSRENAHWCTLVLNGLLCQVDGFCGTALIKLQLIVMDWAYHDKLLRVKKNKTLSNPTTSNIALMLRSTHTNTCKHTHTHRFQDWRVSQYEVMKELPKRFYLSLTAHLVDFDIFFCMQSLKECNRWTLFVFVRTNL